MSGYYDAGKFWERVLSNDFDLTGTGHGGHGPRYNHFLYRSKLRAFERAVRAAGVDLRRQSVVDVGCGVGFFAGVALAAGCRAYTGVDITQTAVERLRPLYPGAAFELADIGSDALPPRLAQEPFDVVLCIDVLYHIVDPERFERALDNLWSLVAPGGHLLIVDAFGERDFIPGGTIERTDGHVPHCRFHKRADYERFLFSRADAETISQTPMYFLFNRPIEGTRWPWTSERLAWHLRRRLLETRAVLWSMYGIDGLATRLRRGGADLKLIVVRKSATGART